MKKLFLLLALFFGSIGESKEKKDKESGPSFVTYEFSGGRFGDSLLCYIHGKWFSYKYDLPLLYKPFDYSDLLVLDREESSETPLTFLKPSLFLDHPLHIKKNQSLLYIVPYFPEFILEQGNILDGRGNRYPVFPIGWEDQNFRSLLQTLIQPKEPLSLVDVPNGIVKVALHMRTGGSYETLTGLSEYPAKAPSDRFYIKGIQIIHEIFNDQPLYVHIFTDSDRPDILAERLRKNFINSNIEFGYREKNNSHAANVLEDFFSFWLFDCLIRPDSNYSYIPSKLHDFQVVISPESAEKHGKYYQVSRLKVEYLDGSVQTSHL